ncbi:MAG: hypothetical protein ABI868_08135 [Acidobacteriota bacterium]
MGGDGRLGAAAGIHWHMNVANEIEYIATDVERQVIPYVRVKERGGTVREYFAAGVTPEQIATGERRHMDCTDCHNRPSHANAATAERAVNQAMALGHIPATLPFVHREAVNALKRAYPRTRRERERLPGCCGSSTGRSSRRSPRRARRACQHTHPACIGLFSAHLSKAETAALSRMSREVLATPAARYSPDCEKTTIAVPPAPVTGSAWSGPCGSPRWTRWRDQARRHTPTIIVAGGAGAA